MVKSQRIGRRTTYMVYDRWRGSFPISTWELGWVPQDHKTEAEAQAVADDLEAKHGKH